MKNKHLKLNKTMDTHRKPSFDRNIDLAEKGMNGAKSEPRKRPVQNLTKGELEELQRLEIGEDNIIITNVDEGVAVVVTDTVKDCKRNVIANKGHKRLR